MLEVHTRRLIIAVNRECRFEGADRCHLISRLPVGESEMVLNFTRMRDQGSCKRKFSNCRLRILSLQGRIARRKMLCSMQMKPLLLPTAVPVATDQSTH